MKKHLFAIAALGTLALWTSCSNEELPAPAGNDGSITFTASLPADILSRAYGDGQTVDKTLHYAVYEAGSDDVVFTSDNTNDPLVTTIDKTSFTLQLQLVKGKSYDFIFWADATEGSPYTFSSATKSVSVSYEDLSANNEKRDAFFQAVKGLEISGPMQQPVELRRPFAQFNILTSDLDALAAAAETKVAKVDVTVKGVRNSLNLYSGIADGAEDVTFTATELPGQSYTIDSKSYDYLAMNYLLTGIELEGTDVQTAKRELMDASATITFEGGKTTTVEVPSMPVQRNYRTNVYGALLTSPLDLTIDLNPEFYEPENNLEYPLPWDGETVVTPTPDDEGNYSIKNGAELAGLLKMVNTDGAEFGNGTIKLADDINLNGEKWLSIGTSSKKFSGTLDGQNHTISGLVSPLFGNVADADIKNLKIEANSNYSALIKQTDGNVNLSGITVEGSVSKSSALSKQGCAGFISNAKTGSVTIDNCVNRAEISDNSYVGGGFVGRSGVPVTITNSKNYGKVVSTRYSGGKAAGFVAMPDGVATTIQNCQNFGEIEVTTSGMAAAGGLIAWVNNEVNIIDSSNEANITATVSNASEISVVGGIYGGNGWGTAKKTFKNCTNSGDVKIIASSVKADAAEYQYGLYAGGIMGSTSYDDTELTACTNSGNITAETQGEKAQRQYVGALVGAFGWSKSIILTGNTVESNVILSGNQGENTFVKALYNYINPGDTNVKITDTPNTNNTSYEDK